MNRVVVGLFAALLVLAAPRIARADDQTSGSWTIWSDGGRASIETRWESSDGKHSNDSTHEVDANALGIANALASSGEHVRFAQHREAGDFAFEGWVGNGKGGGSFTFSANAGFFDDLRKRGFTIDSPGEEMTAASLDITREYIDGLQRGGITFADFHQLVTFRALKIDDAFIRDLASVGFSHLQPHDYVTLRALGVDSSYIKYLQAHGFQNLTVRQVITMKAERI